MSVVKVQTKVTQGQQDSGYDFQLANGAVEAEMVLFGDTRCPQ